MSQLPSKCSHCGSRQIVPGKIGNSDKPPDFHPHDTKKFVFTCRNPYFCLAGDEALLCIACGVLVAKIDVSDAHDKLAAWGYDTLKHRLGIEDHAPLRATADGPRVELRLNPTVGQPLEAGRPRIPSGAMQRILGLLIGTLGSLFGLYLSLDAAWSGHIAIGRNSLNVIEGPSAIAIGVLSGMVVGGVGLVSVYSLLRELRGISTKYRS